MPPFATPRRTLECLLWLGAGVVWALGGNGPVSSLRDAGYAIRGTLQPAAMPFVQICRARGPDATVSWSATTSATKISSVLRE